MDPKVLSVVVAKIHKKYGKTDTVTFTHGKSQNYPGIKIDFSSLERVEITINDSISDILDDAPDDMIGEAVTPAGAHFFQVNEWDSIYLDDKVSVDFNHIVARMLFPSKSARPYVHTAVAFLCTRV